MLGGCWMRGWVRQWLLDLDGVFVDFERGRAGTLELYILFGCWRRPCWVHILSLSQILLKFQFCREREREQVAAVVDLGGAE